MQSVQPIRERIGQYETTMDEATRSILQQQFRAEVQQIEQMLGWDCSEWLEGWL